MPSQQTIAQIRTRVQRGAIDGGDDGADTTLVHPDRIDPSTLGHRELMRLVKAVVVSEAMLAAEQDDGGAHRIPHAQRYVDHLEQRQGPTGLFSSSSNIASPPDSAFSITDALLTLELLHGPVASTAATADLANRLRAIVVTALPALRTGGVHTPNHRWELAAVLAGAGRLLAEPTATARAQQWLAEGVDLDADGLYSERSPNYAAAVSNPALLLLARYLDRPDLGEVVHHNLHAHLDLTSPSGLVETVHSRRQDQWGPFPSGPFLTQYAHFAGTCTQCRYGTALALRAGGYDVVEVLARALLEEPVRTALAAPESTTPPEPEQSRGRRWFPGARLLRVWENQDYLTVYAGSDVPCAGRVASGLATNPTFLRLGLGPTGVDSVRLSRDFFRMGPLRPTEMTVDGDHIRMREHLQARYYQPLAPAQRRPDGQYRLQFEGRYAAAMDFQERAHAAVTLQTTVDLRLAPGGVHLGLTTDGAPTVHTLELAIAPGSTVEVADAASQMVDDGEGGLHLRTGYARVSGGGESVLVGPAPAGGAGLNPLYDPGEAYGFVGGTDAIGGSRLYLTWTSPGQVAVQIIREEPGPR